MEDNREIIVGRLPVMVKSDLCWMKGVEKGNCEYDHGGYFLIKGAEKVGAIYHEGGVVTTPITAAGFAPARILQLVTTALMMTVLL